MSPRSADPVDEVLTAIQAITARAASAEARHRFQQYLDLFLVWNRTYRMTALDSAAAIVRDLFVDSLLLLAILPSRRPLSVVDIGAGAGIPGLPLRLADPQIALTLIDSRRKRISFLLAVRRELELENVAVIEGRAEGLLDRQPELAGAFDVVVARAVGPPNPLLQVALRYLRPGGVFVTSGPPNPTAQTSLEVIRVPVPGARVSRTFLRAVKES